MEMSFDLKMEKAKNEYVDAINEINNKYGVPLSMVEVILNGIYNEVHNMKMLQLQKEQQELNAEKESDN